MIIVDATYVKIIKISKSNICAQYNRTGWWWRFIKDEDAVLSVYDFTIVEIRRSQDSPTSTVLFPLPVRRHLYIE